MRIVFMGTPAFAVPTLDALAAAGHEVVAAYTQPPRAGGRRGKALVPSPVHVRAEELGIDVRTPVTLRDAEAQAAFAALGADVAVVAAYGLILPKPVLAAPRLGCLNVHGSLLPRWRGAAPIQRAILAGDAETGVGIMQMEAGLDTGPVLLEGRTPIGGKTAGELTEELATLGARLMVEVLADPGGYPPRVQPEEGVTYAAKIDKAETRLDFTRDADAVERQVRAFNPPGAWFECAGERVRVLAAEHTLQRHHGPHPSHPAAPGGPSVGSSMPPAWTGRCGASSTQHSSPNWEREGAAKPRKGEDSPAVGVSSDGGLVLDDRLTIACATGAIRPVSVQRAGRGVMTVDELLRGFPIPAGTQL